MRLILAGAILALCTTIDLAASRAGRAASNSVSIKADRGVSPALVTGVATEVAQLRTRVGEDLGRDPGKLQVKIFASHRAFATALWRQDRERPQSQQDNLANVVRGVLLLGPLQPSYLRHNLAHVYTEWVLDGRLGNPAGRLPSHPWLYDGLAEYEAYRVAPARLACRIDQHPALDVRRLSPSRWLALRSGPWGALEYCLAYRAVRAAIARDGLRCLVSFRGRRAWDSLAIQLESGKRPAICASRISPVR